MHEIPGYNPTLNGYIYDLPKKLVIEPETNIGIIVFNQYLDPEPCLIIIS
tara:strand:+ start:15319 stop:15468 length:150 start_codon:yes stop_codon:yes gene_type:complete